MRPLGGCWYFHVIFKKPGTIFQELREFSPFYIGQSEDELTDELPQLLAGRHSSIVSFQAFRD